MGCAAAKHMGPCQPVPSWPGPASCFLWDGGDVRWRDPCQRHVRHGFVPIAAACQSLATCSPSLLQTDAAAHHSPPQKSSSDHMTRSGTGISFPRNSSLPPGSISHARSTTGASSRKSCETSSSEQVCFKSFSTATRSLRALQSSPAHVHCITLAHCAAKVSSSLQARVCLLQRRPYTQYRHQCHLNTVGCAAMSWP